MSTFGTWRVRVEANDSDWDTGLVFTESETAGHLMARLMRKTVAQGDCLVWTGHVQPTGYGVVGVCGKTRYVHRIVLECALGRRLRPTEMAMHTCDNPSCMNIWHLKPGTQAENLRDAYAKGRKKAGKGRRATLTLEEKREAYLSWMSGETQDELAGRFGVSQSAISRYVRALL